MNYEEEINQRILNLSEQEQARQQAEIDKQAETLRLQQEKAESAIKHEQEIRGICGEFAVWATLNNIKYNSPSPLARGWRIGRGDGSPAKISGFQENYFESESGVSLIVKRNLSIRELVVNCVYNHKGRNYHFLSRRPNFGSFFMDSILEDIAAIAYRNGKEFKTK
jgi:hypothetical protein